MPGIIGDFYNPSSSKSEKDQYHDFLEYMYKGVPNMQVKLSEEFAKLHLNDEFDNQIKFQKKHAESIIMDDYNINAQIFNCGIDFNLAEDMSNLFLK